MCYEWGEVGWCHEQPRQAMAKELDWAVVEKLFAQVGRTHPYFILIGGEPTLYSPFRRRGPAAAAAPLLCHHLYQRHDA